MAAKKKGWHDTSSWSRGEDKTTPKQWTLENDALRIVVHHTHGLGDEWFYSCREIGIDRYPLNTTDAEVAKRAARKQVETRLRRMLDALFMTPDVGER